MLLRRFTKIIATLGPVTSTKESIENLRKIREKLWFYWRENVHGILASNKSTINYASGTGLIHFIIHTKEPTKILFGIENTFTRAVTIPTDWMVIA